MNNLNESNQHENERHSSGSALNCFVICSLLLDGICNWKAVKIDKGTTLLKHVDGYSYFADGSSLVRMHKNYEYYWDDETQDLKLVDGYEEYNVGFFMWLAMQPLVLLNTWMVLKYR